MMIGIEEDVIGTIDETEIEIALIIANVTAAMKEVEEVVIATEMINEVIEKEKEKGAGIEEIIGTAVVSAELKETAVIDTVAIEMRIVIEEMIEATSEMLTEIVNVVEIDLVREVNKLMHQVKINNQAKLKLKLNR